jgi:aspartyl-tRNA(Asn)/glutamyl-tRNA(Gln) amidotransferase subunit B
MTLTSNETRSMRSKEEAHDYRYFPDPDLLPLEIEQAWVDDIARDHARTAGCQEGPLHGRFRLTDYDANQC